MMSRVGIARHSIYRRALSLSRRRPDRARRRRSHRVRLAIGNGLSAEVWRAFVDRFGPLHPRILRFDGRQRLALQRRGQDWLSRPGPAVSRAARPDRARSFRPGLPISRAWRLTASASAVRRRNRRGPGTHRPGSQHTLRRLQRKSRDRKENPARCIRSWRRVDANRRPHASRRRTASTLSSTASATPFAGKARTSRRSKSSAVIRTCPGVTEAIVYGVAVPGADGRAGMALMTIDGQFDLDALVGRLEALPSYARPLFLRVAARDRNDGDLQTEAARLRRAGIRPRANCRSALCVRRRATDLCAARRGSLRRDPKRRHPFLKNHILTRLRQIKSFLTDLDRCFTL